MKRYTLILFAALAIGIHGIGHAAADPDNYQLTPAMLLKLQAIDAEAKKANVKPKEDDKDAPEDETVEQFARRIDKEPALKAALAKQGLTSMDFALSSHAMIHAAFYLMFEDSMEKKDAAALYAGYTRAQKANIELLRKSELMSDKGADKSAKTKKR